MPRDPDQDLKRDRTADATLAAARDASAYVAELEGRLRSARVDYYLAVADAVEAQRAIGNRAAQQTVAAALEVSPQRVSELSRRSVTAS